MTKPSPIAEIRRQLRELERQLYEMSRATSDRDKSWRLASAADLLTAVRAAELWRLR